VGSFAQLSLYIYSAVALIALGWALKAVKEEDAKQTLYFAHLFFADHILSTAWTIFFAVVWWVYIPHDGRRQANSAAQEDMMKAGVGGIHDMTDEEREAAAMMIWNHEKGTAAAVIIISWLFKIYFALLLYSYATHLRKGSYRSLPLSRPNPNNNLSLPSTYDPSLADEDEEIEDFYRVPLRTPQPASSITSFADLSTIPGRPRKSRGPGKSLLGKGNGQMTNGDVEMGEELLFDETELSSANSRRGTEDNASISDGRRSHSGVRN